MTGSSVDVTPEMWAKWFANFKLTFKVLTTDDVCIGYLVAANMVDSRSPVRSHVPLANVEAVIRKAFLQWRSEQNGI